MKRVACDVCLCHLAALSTLRGTLTAGREVHLKSILAICRVRIAISRHKYNTIALGQL